MHKYIKKNKQGINTIKIIVLISLFCYFAGVSVGAVSFKTNDAVDFKMFNYDIASYSYKVLISFLVVFFASNCAFGAPLLFYVIYVYGVNYGVVCAFVTAGNTNLFKCIYPLLGMSVFSLLSVAFVGGISVYTSKEMFFNIFSRKKNTGIREFLILRLGMILGFVFFTLADMYKIKLLEIIK